MKHFFSLLLALAGCLLPPAAQAQSTLSNGLLGHFPFDGNTADATGNMSPNTTTNATYAADSYGRANAALRLTANGEVWIEPNGLLDFGTTGNYSFSVRFRTISPATQAFFTNQGAHPTASNTYGQGWFLGFDNSQAGRVYFGLGTAQARFGDGIGLATQASTYNDNAWHTAAVVVSRSTNQIRLFVDGAAQPLLNVSPNPNYGAVAGTVFNIGAQGTAVANASPGLVTTGTGSRTVASRFGPGYNGSLDEARFYNRALTAAEVAELHAYVLATARRAATDAAVQLFPNPAASGTSLTLEVARPVAASHICVLDALGRVVPATVSAATPRASRFAIGGLAPGLYTLRVMLPEGPATRRLLVQ